MSSPRAIDLLSPCSRKVRFSKVVVRSAVMAFLLAEFSESDFCKLQHPKKTSKFCEPDLPNNLSTPYSRAQSNRL